jgi:hypothetical protein
MERLYIEKDNHRVPISEDIIEKYNLKKGMYTQYTKSRIVDEKGDFTMPEKQEKDKPEINEDQVILNNADLTVSEIIDFSQGVDSDTK